MRPPFSLLFTAFDLPPHNGRRKGPPGRIGPPDYGLPTKEGEIVASHPAGGSAGATGAGAAGAGRAPWPCKSKTHAQIFRAHRKKTNFYGRFNVVPLWRKLFCSDQVRKKTSAGTVSLSLSFAVLCQTEDGIRKVRGI